MLVISSKVDAKSFADSVGKTLKEANATDLQVDHLGKRTLAHQISKQDEGEYFVFNFEAPGEAVGKISDKLRLEQEALLRYLIIKSQIRPGAESRASSARVAQSPKVTVKTVVAPKKAQSRKKKEKAKTSPKTAKTKKGKKGNK